MFPFLKKNIARRLGFVHDQQGIPQRYLRERAGWDPHLQRSQQFVWQAAQQAQPHSVVVLGSGWLLDVPIEQLQGRFEQVYLVDMVHPAQVRHRVARWPNVHLVQTDVTGWAADIEALVRQKQLAPNEPFPLHRLSQQALHWAGPAGLVPSLVVSLNLLNQLDILLCDYLRQHLRADDAYLLPLRRAIQQRHLDQLARYPAVLISDYLQLEKPKQGPTTEHSLVLVPWPQAPVEEEWPWVFDTHGLYIDHTEVSFRVRASAWLAPRVHPTVG